MSKLISSLPILPKEGQILQQGSVLFGKELKTSTEKPDDSKLKEEYTPPIDEMDHEGLKEVFSTLVEKGIELIPGVGDFLAPLVKALLGELIKVSDDQLLMQKSLTRVESKIDGLDKQGKESMALIMSSSGLEKLQEVSGQLNDIWARIKEAERTGDGIGFKSAVESIDSAHAVSSWLTVVHTKLMEKKPQLPDSNGDQMNRSSLGFVQSLLQDRALSETYCSNYTIMRYERDIQEWFDYVSEVQMKGAALRIVFQKARLVFYPKKVSLKIVEGMVKEIVEVYEKRVSSYRKALFGGILDYPSSKLIKELSLSDSSKYPKLYNIKHEETGLLFKTGYAMWGSEPVVLTSQRSSNSDDGFAFKGVPDSQDFSTSFGIVFNKDGRWNLRGSRHKYTLDHPSQWNVCLDEKQEEKGFWSSEGYNHGVTSEKLGLFGQSAASFKIIPRDSADGESPLVTLVVWNKEATNMIRTWKVRLQDSKAIQILMFYRTDSPSVEPLGIYNRRSNFHIRNLSNGGLKHVLVFQDAGLNVAYSRRRGQVYTPGLIVLPDHGLPVTWAAENYDESDMEGVLKFRVYRLKEGRDPANPQTISDLAFINPSTGKLSLSEDGATAVEDVFIKIWSPSGMAYNAVSSATRWCEHPEGNIPFGYPLNTKEMDGDFDNGNRRATQNDEKVAWGGTCHLKYSVSGGAKVSKGWVEITPR